MKNKKEKPFEKIFAILDDKKTVGKVAENLKKIANENDVDMLCFIRKGNKSCYLFPNDSITFSELFINLIYSTSKEILHIKVAETEED